MSTHSATIHPEQMVSDPSTIREILSLCDTAYLGLFDDPFPYVVPMSFGFDYQGETLRIFLHSRANPEGRKLRLIQQNNHVSLTFSRFVNWAQGPVEGSLHSYHSVMAYGQIRQIDLGTREGAGLQGTALQAILRHYNRGVTQFKPSRVADLAFFVVECPPSQVFGKSEHPIGSTQGQAFLAAVQGEL